MIAIGFLWAFAQVTLILIVMTLIAYAAPNSLPGKFFSVIK